MLRPRGTRESQTPLSHRKKKVSATNQSVNFNCFRALPPPPFYGHPDPYARMSKLFSLRPGPQQNELSDMQSKRGFSADVRCIKGSQKLLYACKGISHLYQNRKCQNFRISENRRKERRIGKSGPPNGDNWLSHFCFFSSHLWNLIPTFFYSVDSQGLCNVMQTSSVVIVFLSRYVAEMINRRSWEPSSK